MNRRCASPSCVLAYLILLACMTPVFDVTTFVSASATDAPPSTERPPPSMFCLFIMSGDKVTKNVFAVTKSRSKVGYFSNVTTCVQTLAWQFSLTKAAPQCIQFVGFPNTLQHIFQNGNIYPSSRADNCHLLSHQFSWVGTTEEGTLTYEDNFHRNDGGLSVHPNSVIVVNITSDPSLTRFRVLRLGESIEDIEVAPKNTPTPTAAVGTSSTRTRSTTPSSTQQPTTSHSLSLTKASTVSASPTADKQRPTLTTSRSLVIRKRTESANGSKTMQDLPNVDILLSPSIFHGILLWLLQRPRNSRRKQLVEFFLCRGSNCN